MSQAGYKPFYPLAGTTAPGIQKSDGTAKDSEFAALSKVPTVSKRSSQIELQLSWIGLDVFRDTDSKDAMQSSRHCSLDRKA